MTRMNYALAMSGLLLLVLPNSAVAQVDLLDVWNWNSSRTGSQNWQDPANWTEAGFPDNPGYVDPNEADISNSTAANVSVGLGADLNLNVGATDVTVAALRLGGTAGPVATTISGSGGRLVFENFEATDNSDPDNPVFPFNGGSALIVSGGVAGSTNTISAPVFINKERLDIGSDGTNATTNNLTITGPVTYAGGAGDGTQSPSLGVDIDESLQVEISSAFNFVDTNPHTDPAPIATDFSLDVDSGRLVMSGALTGTGHFVFTGSETGTIEIPNANPNLNTRIVLTGGVNFQLGDDEAIGRSQIVAAGGRLVSDDDSRNVGSRILPAGGMNPDPQLVRNPINLSQNTTIAGDHSLELSGRVQLTNARAWVNALPAGKEFVISGPQFIEDEDQIRADNALHEYSINGSGTTRITGRIANHQVDNQYLGSFEKLGSGATYLEGSATQAVDEMTGAPLAGMTNKNTYTGDTVVQGGTLHLTDFDDIASSRAIVSRGGGIGLENGTLTGPDASSFFGKLNNFTNAKRRNILAPTTSGGFDFQIVAMDFENFDAYDNGGLMLAEDEYNEDVDFSSAALANARDMSLAARELGTTTSYTGNITPYSATYRLGGGGGVLELPNQNQLNNTNNLVVQNGLDRGDTQQVGMVRLSNTNSYTGTTKITGKRLSGGYHGSTLAVNSLADGGQDSSIGSSSSDAANLVIQGSTLRYEGGSASTNRLFTVGTYGASLDASGTGTISFTNTGQIDLATVGVLTGDTMGDAFVPDAGSGSENNIILDLPSTADIVPGMTVSAFGIIEDPDDDDETVTVTAISSESRIEFSDGYGNSSTVVDGNQGTFTSNNNVPVTFGVVARDFVLKGENTGDNTFAPLLTSDSSTGDLNLVKQGQGKWVVTNPANAYSGDTEVEAGTLSLTSPFLSDSADVLLLDGALLDLDFSGTDTIGSLFIDGVSQTLGTWGAPGSGAANTSSLFSGTGILSVTMSDVEIQILFGDADNDLAVSGSDLLAVTNNFGNTGPANGLLLGDADDDGAVSGSDLLAVTNNFGMTLPAPGLLTSAAVPEPTAALLLLFGLVPLAARRGFKA